MKLSAENALQLVYLVLEEIYSELQEEICIFHTRFDLLVFHLTNNLTSFRLAPVLVFEMEKHICFSDSTVVTLSRGSILEQSAVDISRSTMIEVGNINGVSRSPS